MSTVVERSVIVIGLGSIGSMALWRLAERGVDVLGVEQYGRIHTEGAYAGESRLFRVAAKEGELFTPALIRARHLWQELSAAYGRDILLPVGALSLAPGDHPDLKPTLRAIEQFDLPHEVFDAEGIRARYPQFHVDDDDIGVLDLSGGAVRPEMAVAAATEQAAANGADFRYHTTVTAIEPDDTGVRVVTTEGEYRARKVVVTAGPWTTRVLPEIADLVSIRTFALTWAMPRHVERFAPELMPGFMRDLDEVHAFGVPTLDGYSIKICPHIDFDPVHEWDDRPTGLTREQLVWAGEQAQRMMPDLIPDVSRWSLHSDSWSDTKMPILDTTADGSVIVASAMSGNGFKFAPIWGETLADLATEGPAEFALAPFRIAAHRAAAAEISPA